MYKAFRIKIGLLSHATTLMLLLFLSYRLGANLRFLRWARRQTSKQVTAKASVSILVPARNEDATISACIRSLLQQDYPNFEVIVLNDASTDGTGAQLNALAATDPKLRIIHGDAQLPAGWNGKSFACHRLAAAATGEWLLFTDADTQHARDSVARGMAQALALNVDLLSAMPAQETRTWSERIFVSFIVDFLPLAGLDLGAIYWRRSKESAANGQYLLMHATSYRRTGGHAAIYNQTLDDFALAKHFRSEGYTIALVDGSEWLRCRMYHSAAEVWEGFSRSLMQGLDNSTTTPHSAVWMLLFAWGYGCLFINSFSSLFIRNARRLALVELLWLTLLRAMASWHLRRSLFEVLTTPIAAWGVMVVGMATFWRRWRGQKVNWKGRPYMG